MLRRLRIKFVCIMMSVVMLMLAAVFALVLYFTQQDLARDSVRMLQAAANRPFSADRPFAPGRPDEVNLPYFVLQFGRHGELLTAGADAVTPDDEQTLQKIVDAALQSPDSVGVLKDEQLRFLRTDTPEGQRILYADISSELATMRNLRRNCVLIGVLGFAHRGTDAIVTPAFNRLMADTNCVGCGQCRVVCPTGALTIHHNMTEVWQALGDKNTRVVVQIAPAVRVAVSEAFGLPKGENSIGKIVAALHRMGFDQVYDTIYSADLTIMEESAEFLDRVANGGTLPLMTSCCPAWVKFVENEYPEFKPNISTCRSPQGMFSAVLKEYYRDEANAQGKKTVVVSIMPCTAKKMEAKRPDYHTFGEQDTDIVLTTKELIRMIDAHGINFEELPSETCDMPFGLGSGGGVIFGTTGGVTEAVLRRLTEGKDPNELATIAECGVRGREGIREFTVPYNGIDVKICVASGLANAREVLESIKSGEKSYHFIEVMACPGGCVMGGGQPINGTKQVRRETRRQGLYNADCELVFKRPHENPLMDVFYNGPFKDKTHELLHTSHHE